MRFSSRVDISELNPIAKAEATAKTAGRPLGKLNDSNPTRHALAPDLVPDIYSADPRGQRYAREALAAFLDMQEIGHCSPDDLYILSQLPKPTRGLSNCCVMPVTPCSHRNPAIRSSNRSHASNAST